MARAKKKQASKRVGPAKPAKARPEGEFFRPFSDLRKLARSKGAERDAKGGDASDASDAKSAAASGRAPASGVSSGKGPRSPGSPPSSPAGFAPAREVTAARDAARGGESAVTPEDAESFAMFMAGVDTIDRTKMRIPQGESAIERGALTSPRPPGEDPDAPARASLEGLVVGALRFDVTDDGDRLEGRRVDVDPRELRRLRHGRFAIDARLDLHGLSLEHARQATVEFVRRRAASGDKVVVIVHGKGAHSPRGLAVLRGEIGAWLTNASAARHVRAFSTATEDEGGAGAVSVLLAR